MAAKRTAETKDCCWDGIYGLCRGLNVNSSMGKRVLGKKVLKVESRDLT